MDTIHKFLTDTKCLKFSLKTFQTLEDTSSHHFCWEQFCCFLHVMYYTRVLETNI